MNGISALFSSKETEVLAALEEAKESGDIQWVRPMMEAFRDHSSHTVRSEIGLMLSSLKISAASDALADAMEDPEFESIYADIIGFMWSSGFVPEESLRVIVTSAVEGDFRLAVEALTWVEELENVHDENQLMDSILLVRGAIEEGKNAEVNGLYEAMLSALLNLERQQ
tara:strand:+ start:2165 stop:2671 length:507 start_codon:yes stop_codon:yes gene_type:complete